MFLRVAAFHRAFGHPVGTTPDFPTQNIRNLRISLIGEELEEYCAAFAANDLVKMADGLADLLYVLAGTAVAYGIAGDTTYESPYETSDFSHMAEMNQYDVYLRTDFTDYLNAEQTNELRAVKYTILRMMDRIFIIARQSNIPINAVFSEVHRSNLSKLGEDGKPILRADGKVLKGPHYTPPDIASILCEKDKYS
jgi:predicted HAD superfamily Cof-like phosphohydrolase